jgi:murein DD-endopeptidase MepM/ murein hydrolase activator NlpD
MKARSYTFIVASSAGGAVRKLRVPHYALHLLALLSVVGGLTVFAAVGSYSRMLWKTANYNRLRDEQASMQRRFTEMQTMVRDTNRRLSTLQSLATEVAMTYGILRFRPAPFLAADSNAAPEDLFRQSVDQFEFLKRNASAVALASDGARLLPGWSLESLAYMPSLWPVTGAITGSFGERLDPFDGEGAFHTGVDISAPYGTEVRAAADGLVTEVEVHAGYGRVVVVEHGFGTTTVYGHLSGTNTFAGRRVKRGDVIGFVGTSGRATGPHLHYEVRLYGAPVNPWRYLRSGSALGAD